LKSRSDTLMEMISRAGGAAKDSAQNIIFVPAENDRDGLERASVVQMGQVPAADAIEGRSDPTGRDRQIEVARVGPVLAGTPAAPHPHASALGLSTMAIAKLNPIEISMTDPVTQPYLGMPARPGDVLIVPAAGEVTVGGWVQNPGAYRITPGMTALSALSAAGGPMFSSSARVLRTTQNGERLSIPVDIPKVRKGEEHDVPMESGDVIMVDKSVAGAVPYAAYELFTKFGTGMFLPMP
jgi:protein involved in polysaccharide export with SLBB domain